MSAIINYIGIIFTQIYNVLNVQFFEDFPVTYIQLIMATFVIGFMFKFIFGGMKEFNGFEDSISGSYYIRLSNYARMRNLNKANTTDFDWLHKDIHGTKSTAEEQAELRKEFESLGIKLNH